MVQKETHEALLLRIRECINSGWQTFELEGIEMLVKLTEHMPELSGQCQQNLREFRSAINNNDKPNKGDKRKILNSSIKIIQEKIPNFTQYQRAYKDKPALVFRDNASFEVYLKDNIRKLGWIEIALQKSKSVCRVLVDSKTNTTGFGSGFIIDGHYLLTNNHVITDEIVAGNTQIEFNFEDDKDGRTRPTFKYDLDPSDFITNAYLDYTRVKILENPEMPLSYWEYLTPLTLKPQENEKVHIIHHPNGYSKHISLLGNIEKIADHIITYDLSTEPGSSGSPIFNDKWEVVAIHRAGSSLANSGTLLKDILADIKKK
jgi:V8-like Glu-specific endopeptidase